jgi:hypothetical protein
MSSTRRYLLLVVALSTGATFRPAPAQPSNELSIEANPFRGSLGYGRRGSGRWYRGISIGFGFPQLDQTPTPAHTDFRDYAHIAPFVRWTVSERLDVDASWRFGAADLRHCQTSDCWFGLYMGPSVGAMVGWRAVKFGPRVTAGWYRGPGGTHDRFVGVAPLNVLVTRRW